MWCSKMDMWNFNKKLRNVEDKPADFREQMISWCNILRHIYFLMITGKFRVYQTHILRLSVIKKPFTTLVLQLKVPVNLFFPHWSGKLLLWSGLDLWRLSLVYTQATGRKEHVRWLEDNSLPLLVSWADFPRIIRPSKISLGSSLCGRMVQEVNAGILIRLSSLAKAVNIQILRHGFL